MSDYITIDCTDYFVIEYRGHTYYIGEEAVLDSDRREIGFISSRGNMSHVQAFDNDHNEIGQMNVTVQQNTATMFETDGDIIEAIEFLRHGTFGWRQ